MGCDIHCYIEYKKPGDNRWRSFGSCINPGRNYAVFARLAGVRSKPSEAMFTPRGLPDDMDWAANIDNQLYITENIGEGQVTEEAAARYVADGCHYINGADGKPAWVTHPDWHTHSWLIPDEWEKAILDGPEYAAMLAAMRSLENSGHKVRVVFWFDN